MRKLYEARDRIEAQLVRDFLASRHIPSQVFGDFLAGAAGELPANLFPAVWVMEDRDLARARELLDEFLAGRARRDADPDWRCPTCGERVEGQFEVCWNCGSPRE